MLQNQVNCFACLFLVLDGQVYVAILVIHAAFGMITATYEVQQGVSVFVVPGVSQRRGIPFLKNKDAPFFGAVAENHVPGQADDNEVIAAYGSYGISLVILEHFSSADFLTMYVVPDCKGWQLKKPGYTGGVVFSVRFRGERLPQMPAWKIPGCVFIPDDDALLSGAVYGVSVLLVIAICLCAGNAQCCEYDAPGDECECFALFAEPWSHGRYDKKHHGQ